MVSSAISSAMLHQNMVELLALGQLGRRGRGKEGGTEGGREREDKVYFS